MRAFTICFAILALVTIKVTAQDTTCTTFETDSVACNDVPYHGCSSHSQVMNVIINSNGDFGCMHPAPQMAVLNCPGGSSCPGTYPYTVAASNPYCEQTYTACGCVGEGCDGGGGGGGGGGNGDCTGDKCECDDGTCDGHCCTNIRKAQHALNTTLGEHLGADRQPKQCQRAASQPSLFDHGQPSQRDKVDALVAIRLANQ
jgi:hypothetical protein